MKWPAASKLGECSTRRATFAEQGVAKAGADLLAGSDNHLGAKTYVRIMTRLRQHDVAFTTLQKALEESAASLPVLKQQMERVGVTGLTDAQWRENVRRTRIETARNGMQGSLQEMGGAVNTYFTPEERLAFAHFAESKRAGMTPDDLDKFAIPLAENAALADQEALWRFQWIMHQAALPNSYPNTQPLVDLQRRRGRFAELGHQMEQLEVALSSTQRGAPLLAAADAYRSAADESNELRVLSTVFSRNFLDNAHEQRFFQLLLAHQPEELVRIASVWPNSSGEEAADYAVAHGSAALSHAVVQARGKARQPVWNKAYNALVGLYFAEPTPDVNNAFLAALGDDPISARLSKPVDRNQQLAGNIWFYYGSRYGEYLGTSKLGHPEDFLPAILEESPATASGYLTLARLLRRRRRQPIAPSPTTITRSNFRPTAPTSTTASPSPTTSRGIAPQLWHSGNRPSQRFRRSSTAPTFPKVSGPISDAPAINSPLVTSSAN